MGAGYWIIIADGFGHGLELVNGRLFEENGRNWWPCHPDATDDQIIEKHNLLGQFEFVKIVR
jgi:hypothetical protein